MKAKSKPVSAQPALVVDSEVVRQIRQHARSCIKTEVCGVLIGQDRDLRIEVTACIEGQNAEEAGAHVTFTQDTWEHIYAVKDKRFPDERIVGWYHSHPGFGIFLSEHDTFIHQNFFSSPGQVAWVFDPHSDEEGCFGWVGSRIERLARISVLDRRGGELAEIPSQPEPSLSAAPNYAAVEPKNNQESMPVHFRRWETEDTDERGLSLEQLVTKVFFSLAILALGGVLSWYFFPHLVIMPVPVDPISGRPLDPQDAQILEEMQAGKDGQAEQPNTAKPSQPPAKDGSGGKGDDAKPK
jgi:proteasome lid subunit RPN8/RPN11